MGAIPELAARDQARIRREGPRQGCSHRPGGQKLQTGPDAATAEPTAPGRYGAAPRRSSAATLGIGRTLFRLARKSRLHAARGHAPRFQRGVAVTFLMASSAEA